MVTVDPMEGAFQRPSKKTKIFLHDELALPLFFRYP
jgi:hypothetical protein